MSEVLVLCALALAVLPASIARGKGRSFFLWYIYGVLLFLVAIIHSIAIAPNENAPGKKKCPSCASIIAAEATICPSCRTDLEQTTRNPSLVRERQFAADLYAGPIDIADPRYQLFLVKRYAIERNNTLEKYVIVDDVFESLELALKKASEDYLVDHRARQVKERKEQLLKEEQLDREERERVLQDHALEPQTIYVIFGVIVVAVICLAWYNYSSSGAQKTVPANAEVTDCPKGQMTVMNECVPK